MTPVKLKAKPAVQAEPEPTRTDKFVVTAPGFQVIEQLNLQVPTELGDARQAAIACFNAVDQGGNGPTTITITPGDSKLTVSVEQGEYVHG